MREEISFRPPFSVCFLWCLLHLVHDYVDERIGVVSLFRINKGSSSKVVAHGLGHNRGLRHHQEPIDLMYSGLLRTPTLRVEGFCKVCLRKLTDNQADTDKCLESSILWRHATWSARRSRRNLSLSTRYHIVNPQDH
jgi:hypothetical protein